MTSQKKTKRRHESDSDDDDVAGSSLAKPDPTSDPSKLSKEVLDQLLDRIEAQLPKRDHDEFDSR
jgi:hypothetical protein